VGEFVQNLEQQDPVEFEPERGFVPGPGAKQPTRLQISETVTVTDQRPLGIMAASGSRPTWCGGLSIRRRASVLRRMVHRAAIRVPKDKTKSAGSPKNDGKRRTFTRWRLLPAWSSGDARDA